MNTTRKVQKRTAANRLGGVCPITLVAALLGCSGTNTSTDSESTGGAATGGASQTAAASAAGGTLTGSIGGAGGSTTNVGTGGSRALLTTSGGNSATGSQTGGTRATGGSGGDTASATGGRSSSGGMPASGGARTTGGTRATGGAATGGTSAAKTTLAGSTGGAATGGSQNSGGVPTAGRSNSGGTVAASGGLSASGGTSGDASNPVTIWMAGDSTMMNCSNSVCPCGWGSQLAGYFNKNVTVTNRAVGGRSVQTWLYESAVTDTLSGGDCVLSSNTYDSRWTSMLSAMKAGDYLMIAFGINDGDTTCPRHVSSTRFQSLLDVMVKAAKDKGATPILLTPTDAIECSGTTVLQKRGFLTETKAVATASGVPLIDLNQLSMTLYGSLGLCPNDGNYTSSTSTLGKFFCEDHTHFEAAGAKQVAGLVVEALRTQKIGLAAYLN